jgi:ATP-dependent helicase IRC3
MKLTTPLRPRRFCRTHWLFMFDGRTRSYRRILSHFNPDVKHPDEAFKAPTLNHIIPIVGFSATFSRHDGLALGSVFQRIVYHRDFLEMIKEQW